VQSGIRLKSGVLAPRLGPIGEDVYHLSIGFRINCCSQFGQFLTTKKRPAGPHELSSSRIPADMSPSCTIIRQSPACHFGFLEDSILIGNFYCNPSSFPWPTLPAAFGRALLSQLWKTCPAIRRNILSTDRRVCSTYQSSKAYEGQSGARAGC